MTLEQILALLQTAFPGVRKDGLAQIARTIMLQATTEEEAQAVIDKLDIEKVKAVVTDYRKEVDKEVSESNKTYEGTLKKKFKFVPVEDPGKEDPNKKTNPDDIASIVEAAVAKAVQPFQEKLSGYEGLQVAKSRQQKFDEIFKDVPEGTFRASQTKDFARIVNTFETDEDFEAYLTEKQTDIDAFNQEMANNGLGQHDRPVLNQTRNKEGVSSSVADYISSQTSSEVSLGGKEV